MLLFRVVWLVLTNERPTKKIHVANEIGTNKLSTSVRSTNDEISQSIDRGLQLFKRYKLVKSETFPIVVLESSWLMACSMRQILAAHWKHPKDQRHVGHLLLPPTLSGGDRSVGGKRGIL